jgi:hypothetical protein
MRLAYAAMRKAAAMISKVFMLIGLYASQMRSPYLPEASAVAAAVQFPALTVQLSVPVPEAALRTSKRGGGQEDEGGEKGI